MPTYLCHNYLHYNSGNTSYICGGRFHGCSFHSSLPTIGNSKGYQATTIMLLQLIFPSNGAQYLNGSYFQIITFALIKNA